MAMEEEEEEGWGERVREGGRERERERERERDEEGGGGEGVMRTRNDVLPLILLILLQWDASKGVIRWERQRQTEGKCCYLIALESCNPSKRL